MDLVLPELNRAFSRTYAVPDRPQLRLKPFFGGLLNDHSALARFTQQAVSGKLLLRSSFIQFAYVPLAHTIAAFGGCEFHYKRLVERYSRYQAALKRRFAQIRQNTGMETMYG